ncbi:MAG: hypothetical protein HY815_34285 [Candidatus Riflebacteria bacterium]|nr:hypothetical protein [Candidatus Riflebacteria bacterium]
MNGTRSGHAPSRETPVAPAQQMAESAPTGDTALDRPRDSLRTALIMCEVLCLTVYLTRAFFVGTPSTWLLDWLVSATALVWLVQTVAAILEERLRLEALADELPDLLLLGFFGLSGPHVNLAMLILVCHRVLPWCQPVHRRLRETSTRSLAVPRIVVLSFASLILLGGFVLSTPMCHAAERSTGLVDALFMATSAVCVTGLAVYDVGQTLSPLGQWILLLLIQIGGLGIMTITTWLALVTGRRLKTVEERVLHGALGTKDLLELRGLVLTVVRATLLIEGTGAIFLAAFFWSSSSGALGALNLGIFHAVSAFCNAGFTLFGTSLVPYRAAPEVLLVVAALIIAGGLGFDALAETFRAVVARARRTRLQSPLSPSSKLALISTGILLGAGTLGYFFCEHGQTFSGMTLGEKVVNSFFCSVTARTAGFNTVDYGQLARASLLLTLILMFIGACPGGTGGGIRATTAAIAVVTLRSMRGSRGKVTVLERKIPVPVMLRALTIIVAYGGGLLAGVFILTLLEPFPLTDLFFEATSAIGTVGLSTGITPKLSDPGKLVLVILMFLGRVGMGTMVVVWDREEAPADILYPEERFTTG